MYYTFVMFGTCIPLKNTYWDILTSWAGQNTPHVEMRQNTATMFGTSEVQICYTGTNYIVERDNKHHKPCPTNITKNSEKNMSR